MKLVNKSILIMSFMTEENENKKEQLSIATR